MLAKTVGDIRSYFAKFDDSMPLYERVEVRVVRVHPELYEGKMHHTFCYDEKKDFENSKFGCCERARQINTLKPVDVIRISSK